MANGMVHRKESHPLLLDCPKSLLGYMCHMKGLMVSSIGPSCVTLGHDIQDWTPKNHKIGTLIMANGMVHRKESHPLLLDCPKSLLGYMCHMKGLMVSSIGPSCVTLGHDIQDWTPKNHKIGTLIMANGMVHRKESTPLLLDCLKSLLRYMCHMKGLMVSSIGPSCVTLGHDIQDLTPTNHKIAILSSW